MITTTTVHSQFWKSLIQKRKRFTQQGLKRTINVYFLSLILLVAFSQSSFSATGSAHYKVSIHVVKKGETLFGISKKYGAAVKDIKQLNTISSSFIFAGQKLKVPVRFFPSSQKVSSSSTSNFYQHLRFVAMKRREFGTQPSQGRIHHITYNGSMLAKVEDRVPSRHTVHHDGIRYYGRDYAYHSYIARYTKSLREARALEFASSNEGRFDALNFYDGSASVGFIQFNAKHGAMGYLLALIKEEEPYVFKQLFQNYGVDVSHTRHGAHTFSNVSIMVLAPEGYRGKVALYNNEAVTYLRQNKRLAGIFIRAFRHERLKACQVRAAVHQFVEPIQQSYLTIGGKRYKAGRLLRSDAGTAAMVDLSVKLGTVGAKRLLQKAVRHATLQKGKGYAGVSYITEYEIVKSVIAVTTNTTVKKRMQKLLNTKLSFYPQYV